MERAARRVAQGDFGARFESGARDELGQLARTLDAMQRQLAELETARRRFIATASHELRTPIFSLSGFLELLEDEELDEETRAAFLRQLRQQVDRLGKLATELLDLSRLEAGSLELRPEPTDIGELAKSVAAEFTPALAAHESHLELRLTGGRVEALCDPERVAQIMRILIDNALNHTPAGTDVVLAATRRNGRARLSVTDFGTGIKRGDLERVFEPFFTSDDAQGSGLGLAIAHELADRMDGRPQRRERARAHDLRPGAAAVRRARWRAASRPRRCWPPAAAAGSTTTRHGAEHDDQGRGPPAGGQERRRLRSARDLRARVARRGDGHRDRPRGARQHGNAAGLGSGFVHLRRRRDRHQRPRRHQRRGRRHPQGLERLRALRRRQPGAGRRSRASTRSPTSRC